MVDGSADGDFPAEFLTLKYPLPNFSAALRGKDPVKIVAIGSSSTAGREDVVPYPSRLEMYLRRKYANPRIDVINRGKGGEEASGVLMRVDTDVYGAATALVVWQRGTCAVVRNCDIAA